MADNYQVRDANGALITIKSKEISAGIHLPQSVSSDITGTPYSSTNPLPLKVPSYALPIRSNTITLVGGVYAHGDLIANHATAGSVTPFQFANAAVEAAGVLRIERMIAESNMTALPTNPHIRVHFFGATLTPSNGDNGAFLTPVANYCGAADISFERVFSDAIHGAGLALTFTPITMKLPSGTTLYALVEARPGTGNTLTLTAASTLTLGIEAYRFWN